MLTKDLLRFRLQGNYVKVSWIDEHQPDLLDLASRLLLIYRSSLDTPREELESLCNECLSSSRDLKLSRGILKMIDDHACYNSFKDVNYQELRRCLFRRSADLMIHGGLPADSREVRDAVFATSPEEFAPMAQRIYPDLPGSERLIKVPDFSPEEVLARYNLSLAQSLILYTTELNAVIFDPNQSKLRKLMNYLKFFRLLALAEFQKSDGETEIKLKISGPASILENSTKYGLQLACFFPAVCKMQNWKISCDILLGGKARRLLLNSKEELLHVRHMNLHAYVPEEIRIFGTYFQKNVKHWQLTPSPELLHLPGTSRLIFPDFEFQHADGTRFALELFHRWHSAQLEERLPYLDSHPGLWEKGPHLLLGVDRHLLKKDGVLEKRLSESVYFQRYGFLFRDFPGVERVVKLLDEWHDQASPCRK